MSSPDSCRNTKCSLPQAIALLLRGGCLIVLFAVTFVLWHDLPLALLVWVICAGAIIAAYDFRVARRLAVYEGGTTLRFSWKQLQGLALTSLPLGFVGAIGSFNTNIPRYTIQHVLSVERYSEFLRRSPTRLRQQPSSPTLWASPHWLDCHDFSRKAGPRVQTLGSETDRFWSGVGYLGGDDRTDLWQSSADDLFTPRSTQNKEISLRCSPQPQVLTASGVF